MCTHGGGGGLSLKQFGKFPRLILARLVGSFSRKSSIPKQDRLRWYMLDIRGGGQIEAVSKLIQKNKKKRKLRSLQGL